MGFKNKLDIALDKFDNPKYSREFAEAVSYDYHRKVRALLSYKQKTMINTAIVFYRASQSSFSGLKEDYNLSDVTTQPVKLTVVEGQHAGILSNPKLGECINDDLYQFFNVEDNRSESSLERRRQ